MWSNMHISISNFMSKTVTYESQQWDCNIIKTTLNNDIKISLKESKITKQYLNDCYELSTEANAMCGGTHLARRHVSPQNFNIQCFHVFLHSFPLQYHSRHCIWSILLRHKGLLFFLRVKHFRSRHFIHSCLDVNTHAF